MLMLVLTLVWTSHHFVILPSLYLTKIYIYLYIRNCIFFGTYLNFLLCFEIARYKYYIKKSL